MPNGGFTRTIQQRIVHWTEAPIERPMTGDKIVTAVTQMLLQGKPYFSLAN
jgi:hypothetical protein